MTQTAFFSVVIVTFRRPRELTLVLEALERQEACLPFEVLVVDNDPEKSGHGVLAPFLARNPGWRYEVSPSNNVSLARNLGAGLAQGRWLAFLDDDCVPPGEWLQQAGAVIPAFPREALIFGGPCLRGVVEKKWRAESPRRLKMNEYLLEGNMFFSRREYLALGGMRKDLGPSQTRFGYHEGSELQDRHRRKFAEKHCRVLQKSLAVRHLNSNPLPASLLSFISGFDSVRAFSRKKKLLTLQVLYLLAKLPAPLVRLLFSFGNIGSERKKRILREMYRLGESVGEINFLLSAGMRTGSSRIRYQNNRLTTRSGRVRPYPRVNASVAYGRLLSERRPFAAGKIGTAEILGLEFHDRYLHLPNFSGGWRRPALRLANNAGFFPVEKKPFSSWDAVMRDALGAIDYLCTWQADPFLAEYEGRLVARLAPLSHNIPMQWLGKAILPEIAPYRWLVVSPFVQTMQKQLYRLHQIHDPDGKWSVDWKALESGCRFLRCPLQWHLQPSPYSSWAEGLEDLANRALAEEFDLALIGAGAWSLPLAARIKKSGRAAIHTGGETQLFFGIKGSRWNHENFYNPSWVSVLPEETPAGRHKVDDGCYW
jgi:glycosyltransferase involved in cell wall biosynthesis